MGGSCTGLVGTRIWVENEIKYAESRVAETIVSSGAALRRRRFRQNEQYQPNRMHWLMTCYGSLRTGGKSMADTRGEAAANHHMQCGFVPRGGGVFRTIPAHADSCTHQSVGGVSLLVRARLPLILALTLFARTFSSCELLLSSRPTPGSSISTLFGD